MRHTQITFTPVNGSPVVLNVKSVIWHYEPGLIQSPTKSFRLEASYMFRMRLRRKFRKAIRHAGRNTTPMKLRRIRK